MELMDYGKMLRRWWWLVTLGALLGALGAYKIQHDTPPSYLATTRLFVNQMQGPGVPTYDDLQTSERLTKTYTEMLHSSQVLNETIKQLNLPLTAKALDSKIAADAIRDTRLLQISVEDNDAALATTITNTLAQVLVRRVQALQATNNQAALRQIDGAITTVQGQIGDTSARLNTLRAGIDASGTAAQEIQRLQAQLAQYDQDLRDIRFRTSDVSNRLNQLKTIPEPTGADTGEIQRLQAQLNQLDQDQKDVRQRYTDTSAQLDKLRATPVGGAVSAEAQGLQDQLSQYQDNYRRLLDTRQSVTLAQAQGLAALTISDPALVPTIPEPTRATQNIGLGALLGLLLAAGAALALTRLDDRLRDPREVGERLAVATLATVPSARRGAPRVAMGESARPSEVTEALRLLRASLPHAPTDGARVICVTSARRREGTSTIAANLAVVEAHAGQRVVLIDANLRNPGLHTVFLLANDKGLSTLLAQEESDLDAVLQSGPYGIEILPSGPVPANPAALLDSPLMAALLYDLRRRSDLIILDAAPVLPVMDTLILQQHADGNLVVADLRRAKGKALGQALAAIEHASGTVLGVVLNRVKRGKRPYGDRPRAAAHAEKIGDMASASSVISRAAHIATPGQPMPQPVPLDARRRGTTSAVSLASGE